MKWREAGLRLPSIVRLEKLATVGKSTVVKKNGTRRYGRLEVNKKSFGADLLGDSRIGPARIATPWSNATLFSQDED
jgi:hypothetical protein